MPKKHLGQHFIKNPSLAKKIVEYANIKKHETVLEIGPGKGILTKFLSENAKKVIAVEKDKELADELEGRWKNVKIIQGDALKIKWPKFDKVVANLPYNISSPFMFRLFDCKWKLAILLFQKEFADRFAAKPCEKKYSRLTVATNYYCNTKILKKVSSINFYPKPKVDSAVVGIVPKKPEFKTDKKFWFIVKELFRHKRKLVRAALKVSNISAVIPQRAKNKKLSEHILEKLPEPLAKKRVVCCTLKDLKEIYNNISAT